MELKTVEFEPEHAGKLNLYLKAVDAQLRQEEDQPSIGMLLCKKKDKMVHTTFNIFKKANFQILRYDLLYVLGMRL